MRVTLVQRERNPASIWLRHPSLNPPEIAKGSNYLQINQVVWCVMKNQSRNNRKGCANLPMIFT